MEPTRRQWEVVYLPTTGHSVVLGTAGSGKSTVAVLRSQYLASPSLFHAGRVLLVTFTRCLTEYLRNLVGSINGGVDIQTFHDVGRSLLAQAGLSPLYNACAMRGLQRQAVSAFQESYPTHRLASRPLRFFADEFGWITGHGIRAGAEYCAAERVGRAGARLLRDDRAALFDIYLAYVDLRRAGGYEYDLDDVYARLNEALQSGESTSPYDHVVVDEAQDLPPEALRAAAQLTPQGGSLTVFADYSQQIYGHRMSWRSAGLTIPRVWQLVENYRNTKQIADVARALATSPGFVSEEVLPPADAVKEGPRPVLIGCPDESSELQRIGREASRLTRGETTAVLTRTVAGRNLVRAALPPSAVKLDRNITRFPNGVYYGTLHAAKGLEFDKVIIARVSAEQMPDPASVEAVGEEEARAEDLRLLYMGVTRARRQLVMTYTGLLTPLLAAVADLFERRTHQ